MVLRVPICHRTLYWFIFFFVQCDSFKLVVCTHFHCILCFSPKCALCAICARLSLIVLAKKNRLYRVDWTINAPSAPIKSTPVPEHTVRPNQLWDWFCLCAFFFLATSPGFRTKQLLYCKAISSSFTMQLLANIGFCSIPNTCSMISCIVAQHPALLLTPNRTYKCVCNQSWVKMEILRSSVKAVVGWYDDPFFARE